MKKFVVAAVLAVCTLGVTAQTVSTTTLTKVNGKDGQPLPSPRMLTTAKVGEAEISIDYGAPSVKGRKVFFDLQPLDKIWRAGANEATGLKTTGDLMIGTQHVPAGSYTLFVLPTKDGWWLAINKQTGQWGLTYDEKQDLGRVKLDAKTLPSSQEVLSYSVEDIKGMHGTLHLRWATEDLSVKLMTHK